MRWRRPTAMLIVCAGLLHIGSSVWGGDEMCGPATLTLDAGLCGPVGSQFVAEIAMVDAPFRIAGGQYFLLYSQSSLEVVGCSAGDPPFTVLLACETDTPGSIGASTFVPLMGATAADTVMLRVVFEVLSRESDVFIRFDRENHFPTRLSGSSGVAILPHLRDAEVSRDDLAGYAELQNCFSVDGVVASPECRCAFDRDTDGDVDEVDAAAFLADFVGPKIGGCAVE